MPNIAWSETADLAQAVDTLYENKMASTPNGGSGQGPGDVYAPANNPPYKGRGDLPSKYAGYTGSTYYTGIPKFMGNTAEPYNIQNGRVYYFYQTFKFAYYEGPDYDAYERYRGEKGDIPKGPLLISMFCANQHGYYEAGDRFANIADQIFAVSGNNVANLCEAEYDKLKCWWDGLETYAQTPTTACEIYFRSQSSPCVFYRVALASNSPSGNGNGSHFMYGKPYPPGGISDSLEMNEHFTLQEVAFNQIYPPHRNPTSTFYPPPPLCTCKSPNFPNLGAESGMYADSIGTSAFPGNPSQDMIDESKLRPMAQVTDLHMNFGKIYPDSSDPQVLASRLSQGFVFASDVASYNHGNNGTITYTNQHLNSVIQAQTKLIFVTGRGSTPTYHFIEAPTCLSIAISAQVVVAIRKRWYDYIYQKIRFIAGAWYEDIGFPIGTTYDKYTGALGAMLSPCARMQRELKDPLKSGFKSSAASDNDFLGERYFEQWLCDHNAQYDTENCSYTASCPGSSSSSGFNEQAGGFGSNAEKYSMLNDATCQKDVTLPWQGGCSNTSCEGWPSVHKYTIDSLNKIITTLNQEKLSEQQLTSSGRIVTLQDGPFPGITQGGGKWVACSRSWVGVFGSAPVCGGVQGYVGTCGGTTVAWSEHQLNKYLGSNASVTYNVANNEDSSCGPAFVNTVKLEKQTDPSGRFHYYDKGYCTPAYPRLDDGVYVWSSSQLENQQQPINISQIWKETPERPKDTTSPPDGYIAGDLPGLLSVYNNNNNNNNDNDPIYFDTKKQKRNEYCKVGFGLNPYPRWVDVFKMKGVPFRGSYGVNTDIEVYGVQLPTISSMTTNDAGFEKRKFICGKGSSSATDTTEVQINYCNVADLMNSFPTSDLMGLPLTKTLQDNAASQSTNIPEWMRRFRPSTDNWKPKTFSGLVTPLWTTYLFASGEAGSRCDEGKLDSEAWFQPSLYFKDEKEYPMPFTIRSQATGRDLNIPQSINDKGYGMGVYYSITYAINAENGQSLWSGYQQVDFAETVTVYSCVNFKPTRKSYIQPNNGERKNYQSNFLAYYGCYCEPKLYRYSYSSGSPPRVYYQCRYSSGDTPKCDKQPVPTYENRCPFIDDQCSITQTEQIKFDYSNEYDRYWKEYKLTRSSPTTATISSKSGSTTVNPPVQTPCSFREEGVPPDGIPLLVTLESESSIPIDIDVQPQAPENPEGANPKSFSLHLGRGATQAAFLMNYGGWKANNSSDCTFQGGDTSPCRGTLRLQANPVQGENSKICGDEGNTKITVKATPYLGPVYGYQNTSAPRVSDTNAKLGCWGVNCPLEIVSANSNTATCKMRIPGMGTAVGLLMVEILASKSSNATVRVSNIRVEGQSGSTPTGYIPGDRVAVYKDVHGGGCLRYYLENAFVPSGTMAGLSDTQDPYYSFSDDGVHLPVRHIWNLLTEYPQNPPYVIPGYGWDASKNEPPGIQNAPELSMGWWDIDTETNYSKSVYHYVATEDQKPFSNASVWEKGDFMVKIPDTNNTELTFYTAEVTEFKNPGKHYYLGASDPGNSACSSPSYYYSPTQPSQQTFSPIRSQRYTVEQRTNNNFAGSLNFELWAGPCDSGTMQNMAENDCYFQTSGQTSPTTVTLNAGASSCKKYNSQYRTLLCLKIEGNATGRSAQTFAKQIAMARNSGFAPYKYFDSRTGKCSAEDNWMTKNRIIETVINFTVTITGVS